MHRLALLIAPLIGLGALAAPTAAIACGGLFCDAVIDPVVQTAERVLFRVNPDDTITSVIEIQFEGEPTQFAWILPLPAPIDTATVTTAPAGLFDALEELTAPRFVTASASAVADVAGGMSAGCGWEGSWDGMGGGGAPDFSSVEVVGGAVVGPYSIEMITGDDPAALLSWLQWNGYQIPTTAQAPIASYIASGASFLGVKLNPDVPAGPVDALKLTFPGTAPSLPLLLTSVAAMADMDVTAYVLADERWAPVNYVDHGFDWTRVEWDGVGRTDYLRRLPSEVDALGGRAFVTEFAGRTEALPLVDGGPRTMRTAPRSPEEAAADLLRTAPYLTRFRTVISPEEMTVDPLWGPAPSLGDVSNEHVLGANTVATAVTPVWLAALLLIGVLRRRAVQA